MPDEGRVAMQNHNSDIWTQIYQVAISIPRDLDYARHYLADK